MVVGSRVFFSVGNCLKGWIFLSLIHTISLFGRFRWFCEESCVVGLLGFLKVGDLVKLSVWMLVIFVLPIQGVSSNSAVAGCFFWRSDFLKWNFDFLACFGCFSFFLLLPIWGCWSVFRVWDDKISTVYGFKFVAKLRLRTTIEKG